MAPISEPTPPKPSQPARKTPAEQKQLVEEFRARNRAFPTLNRMATGVALYGFYSAFYAVVHAAQTGRWIGLTTGFLILLWSFSLSGQLRHCAKWAWWLTVVAASLLVLRFALSLCVQLILVAGIAGPTELLFFDPLKIGFHLVGLGLALNVLCFALATATRALFFAPKNNAPT